MNITISFLQVNTPHRHLLFVVWQQNTLASSDVATWDSQLSRVAQTPVTRFIRSHACLCLPRLLDDGASDGVGT